MAQALGVRVYTIGAGSQGTARMPVADPLRGTSYATVQVDIDEVSLREIAELTGGQYFRATDTESLAQIWEQIDELETTEIEVQNYTQYEERFSLVLIFGFLMLGLELGLSSTVLRRLP
jgi:Ca-activated chloride channel family protein